MTQFGYQPSLHSPFFPPVRGNKVGFTPRRRRKKATSFDREANKDAIAQMARELAQQAENITARRRRILDKMDYLLGYDIAPNITMGQICAEVAQKYGVTIEDMKSERRWNKVVLPRQEAMYRCRYETRYSLPRIGRFFGGRDHTTVRHAVKRHAKRLGLA